MSPLVAQLVCLIASAASLAACANADLTAPSSVLSANQTVDLIKHPTKWHGRPVRLKLYPYDLGLGQSDAGWSYVACFEICDHAGADKSPFLVRSKVARFNGYKGDRPVIVSAIYNACNVDWPCADLWAGVFKEIE